jgi:hypothetical protein
VIQQPKVLNDVETTAKERVAVEKVVETVAQDVSRNVPKRHHLAEKCFAHKYSSGGRERLISNGER